MRAVGADPRTHRLMMHAQLASDAPVTHALFCKRQSLSFSRLIVSHPEEVFDLIQAAAKAGANK